MYNVIICGPNGCGKTTLGQELAKKLNCIHKDIESYYFESSTNEILNGGANDNLNKSAEGKIKDYKYAKPRPRAEVVHAVENDFARIKSDSTRNLIFTACKGDYGNITSFIDIAIYINLDKNIRLERVRQRSINQFGDRAKEGGDLYEKELQFFNMVKSRDEAEYRAWFDSLNCKNKIELDGSKSIEENVAQVLQLINI